MSCVNVSKERGHKLDPRAKECIFVGIQIKQKDIDCGIQPWMIFKQ